MQGQGRSWAAPQDAVSSEHPVQKKVSILCRRGWEEIPWDSLILLDYAHIAKPFPQSLQAEDSGAGVNGWATWL